MTIDLTDPVALALLTAEQFEAENIPYALYGGLALAAYGEPHLHRRGPPRSEFEIANKKS